MTSPKIIVVPGSSREGSHNRRLAATIARQLNKLGAEAEAINLADFPLPLYNGDLEEESGPPDNAIKLAKLIDAFAGVVLVNPEYNGSFTPLMKNTLDWLSRDVGVKVFKNRVFGLTACSPGAFGGMRVLAHARDNLVAVGADMITPQLAVGNAATAFDEDGNLSNERSAALLQSFCETLIQRAKTYA